MPPARSAEGRLKDRWPHFPFCSERCRLIDLGMWFNEGYRIPGPSVLPDEFLEVPSPSEDSDDPSDL
ncbi:MAG TPA: DNA gyrase inhibitor YacG [Planctomycetota bacterium]|nr:DNA gyrase inhibitor YacG [Planctomycetota bacterium]